MKQACVGTQQTDIDEASVGLRSANKIQQGKAER